MCNSNASTLIFKFSRLFNCAFGSGNEIYFGPVNKSKIKAHALSVKGKTAMYSEQ